MCVEREASICALDEYAPERSFRLSISEFPYFRRRRPDRHGRTRGFAGGRRRVGAQQIGDPLEGGEHALVLFGRRRRLGGGNLERRVGSRWQRVGAGDRPPLDVDRGYRAGPDVGRTRLQVGAGRRTGLYRLRLNVRNMRRRLDAGSAGRNGDWRRPDIGLARRHIGPTGLDVDRRRTSVGEARFDRASFGAGRLASTLASAARARASADFWPRGSFSATLVSVFVCLRGGNAFASFAALRAGCATGASVSCCGAGLCLLTAAAAGGEVGWVRSLPATSLAVGLT
jgi:hypothetical protein